MVWYNNYSRGKTEDQLMPIEEAQCLRDENEWDVVYFGLEDLPNVMNGCSCGFYRMQRKCKGRTARVAAWQVPKQGVYKSETHYAKLRLKDVWFWFWHDLREMRLTRFMGKTRANVLPSVLKLKSIRRHHVSN